MWTRAKALYPAILFAACLLPRIAQWSNLEVIHSLDSASYIELAERMAGLDFRDYDGTRTPVYPLLIVFCELNLDRVWHVQSLMGVFTALMLYQLVYVRTQRSGLSFAAMLLYAWNIVPLFFEAMIMSEALAGFLVTLTFFLLSSNEAHGKSSIARYSLVGFTAALAGLTRPPLLFNLAAVLLCFVTSERRAELGTRKPIVKALALSGSFLLPVSTWCAFNWAVTGVFAPTTLTGYNLIVATDSMVELAPDRYGTIKSVYARCRNGRLSRGEPARGTIFECGEEMQRATGLSFTALSRELTRMSLWLMLHHPLRYGQAVGMAWLRFWGGPPVDYWDVGAIRRPFWRALAHAGSTASKVLVYATNGLFLVAILALLLSARTGLTRASPVLISTICAVLTASIVQAVVGYGGRRKAVPYYPLILFVVMVSLHELENRAANSQQ